MAKTQWILRESAISVLIKARYGKPLRLKFAGAIYDLTSRGNARQKVFPVDTTESYL
jgi:hypothetical protein